jgi:8-oxo-dGTP diphosphatase
VNVSALHVVAAVIRGQDGNIFLAKRPSHLSQGGKWEFPGGKVEAGETRLSALQRELDEEIGISVTAAEPLIQVRHRYVERLVYLDVWEVTGFTGEPYGREGQETRWVSEHTLSGLTFPEANLPIITAAQLPSCCLITPEPEPDHLDAFLSQLKISLQAGIRLVQFRAKVLPVDAYVTLGEAVIRLVHAVGGEVILNSPPVLLAGADGVHLSSRQLWQEANAGSAPHKREGMWLSASCHSAQELEQAAAIGVDFAFLSPVLPTASHPGTAALGWDAFRQQVEKVNFPVFALGGMGMEHVATARQYGGQGVAAIRSLWGDSLR